MTRLIACLLAVFIASATPARAQDVSTSGRFRIVFDDRIQTAPYTGRIYIVLARSSRPEPRRQMGNWFNPAQTLALDVNAITPNASVELADTPLAFPAAYADIKAGEYWVQVVARRSLDHPSPGEGPGDLYSKPIRIRFETTSDATTELRLTEVVAPRPFKESDDLKLVELRSGLLSEFHGRDYMVRASVQLPEGWAGSPEVRWPSVVMIGGFGGTHHDINRLSAIAANGELKDCIVIVPDASCGTGHSVFADSANNGPWGAMLTQELLPEIDRRFRTGGAATRHITGISSGGWASLWLQVTYPEQFASCWSHVPDPVDFRDFQQIDLYAADINMYKDPAGTRRPLARNGGQVMLWYDNFCRMEQVLGRGGQISSFEAVFGPRGENGQPRPLFDRRTGEVDPVTAKSWEPYDIRLVIERGWRGADGALGLRERLAGKLHVYAGELDNFYLEGAARKLKASLHELGSDAVVVIVEGMGHAFAPEGIENMREALHAAKESGEPVPAGR